MPDKFDRCVDDVKASGTADNPYAVCMDSVGNEITQNKIFLAEAECKPGEHFCEAEGKCMPNSDEMDQENPDINGELAQSMHEQQFGEQLISKEDFTDIVGKAKSLSAENKNTVLGMAYNFYDKIFFHDDVAMGASFDNVVTQEFLTVINEVMRDLPHVTVTKEILASEMTKRGLDAMQVYEFLKSQVTIETHKDPEMYPNVTNIPPVESGKTDLTVPNINAENDFIPNDILFGGEPREDAIQWDPKSKKKRQ